MNKKQDLELMVNGDTSVDFDRGRTKAMIYGDSTGDCEDNQEGSEEEKWHGGINLEDKVEMVSRIADNRPINGISDLDDLE